MTRPRSIDQPGASASRGITADQPGFGASARLEVSSPAIADGAPVPQRHSDYGDGISPDLRWTDGPAGTASYVVLLEDPDAHGVWPWVHWAVYNLPPGVGHLPEGLGRDPVLAAPHGAMQGVGTDGSVGYFGPRPPGRDPAHRYYFEVFALDVPLPLPGGAAHEDVCHGMRGHVLASGVLMGTYAARH
jgi:Raf kinase inhibitor-like YbhB/YbcL family protein